MFPPLVVHSNLPDCSISDCICCRRRHTYAYTPMVLTYTW